MTFTSCIIQAKQKQKKNVNTLLVLLFSETEVFWISDTKSVPYRFFPRLASYWRYWMAVELKKNMLLIKAKNKQITFFFIKTLPQTLASTKKKRCIQSPVKHLRRSSSGGLARWPDFWLTFFGFCQC